MIGQLPGKATLNNTGRGIYAPKPVIEQSVSFWWSNVWFRHWTSIVSLYLISFYLANGRKGMLRVAWPLGARVALYRMLAVITGYEITDTRISLTACVMIYKPILQCILSRMWMVGVAIIYGKLGDVRCYCCCCLLLHLIDLVNMDIQGIHCICILGYLQ